MATRRDMMRGMAAMGGAAVLAGCNASAQTAAPSSRFRAVPNAGYDAWVAAYRGRAQARGIPAGVLDAAFREAGFVPEVVRLDRNQAERRRSLEDYLALTANEAKVARGRPAFRRMASTLSAIEGRYGVPARTIAGLWGVESDFGTKRGEIPVISALSTLAFDGRRGAYFESELTNALRILAAGDTTAARMRGSWAGASGHTQFMPSSYLERAVDFDGDGRRDIWADDPTDALASAANFLARAGWRRGLPWGLEVTGVSGGVGQTRAMSAWAAAGARPAQGGSLPGGSGTLLRPQAGGPLLLVTPNFRVLRRYNPSDSYAIAVGHLGDRVAGQGNFVAGFGADATGLTIDQRRTLQAGLNRAGYDVGTPDGVIGAKTTAAIEAFQRDRGLAVTGLPSPDLLAALR
ncbi:lytic murein transglycosylase [Jannaschia sp. Os4]|uniref:lytic murein transglycosylase n=1 Tax=Jannaschia sp. Os4 TaxID=2807617 RepID=UPI001939ADF2|nr:lytic murein transglycosylase [Jannaschia sp. Os4]MBM2576129.1 lytic murein transglycosylase [Jannaschia sp. Os4]